MIKYLVSKEFLITVILFIVLLRTYTVGDLANYVQVTQIFAWSYIIYRLHKHHKLMKEFFEGDDDE